MLLDTNVSRNTNLYSVLKVKLRWQFDAATKSELEVYVKYFFS